MLLLKYLLRSLGVQLKGRQIELHLPCRAYSFFEAHLSMTKSAGLKIVKEVGDIGETRRGIQVQNLIDRKDRGRLAKVM